MSWKSVRKMISVFWNTPKRTRNWVLFWYHLILLYLIFSIEIIQLRGIDNFEPYPNTIPAKIEDSLSDIRDVQRLRRGNRILSCNLQNQAVLLLFFFTLRRTRSVFSHPDKPLRIWKKWIWASFAVDICTFSIHQFGCWFCARFFPEKSGCVATSDKHERFCRSCQKVKSNIPVVWNRNDNTQLSSNHLYGTSQNCVLVKLKWRKSRTLSCKGPLFATSHDCRHRLSNLQHGIQNKEGCKLKPKQGRHWCVFCALNFWLFWSWRTALNQRIWRESQYRLHLPCCPFQL